MQIRKRTVRYLADHNLIDGRMILMRVDFNVPFKDGAIADDTRIRAALPTIDFLRLKGARLVLCSHLGRPQREPVSKWPSRSLEPVVDRLASLLGEHVHWAFNCVDKPAKEARKALGPGQVLLLENTRFHCSEELNSPDFAALLAEGCDAFVNDAFGAVHRAHASTVGVVEAMPGKPHVMGFLVERELQVLQSILNRPDQKLVVILGGLKVSDKIGVVRNLLPIAHRILIGGAMSYTFLHANGHDVGKSIVEEASLEDVRAVQREARERGVEILLPTDVVVAPAFDAEAPATVVSTAAMPADQEGMDIGPETAAAYVEAVRDADMVFWNGPMGVFEFPRFAAGTNTLAKGLAECAAEVVVGGGESVSAVAPYADKFHHICTGGGASLEFLEGRELPGITALDDED